MFSRHFSPGGPGLPPLPCSPCSPFSPLTPISPYEPFRPRDPVKSRNTTGLQKGLIKRNMTAKISPHLIYLEHLVIQMVLGVQAGLEVLEWVCKSLTRIHQKLFKKMFCFLLNGLFIKNYFGAGGICLLPSVNGFLNQTESLH